MTMRDETRPDPATREIEEILNAADPDQIRRLMQDIRKIKPWWNREPMGRA